MFSFIFSVNQKLRVAIILIYLGIIITLSLIPANEVPQISWFEGVDKVVHFCMYLGFTWLLSWTLNLASKVFVSFLIIILSIGWGLLMEILQMIMHFGRTFEWMDVLANSLGALVGVMIYTLIVKSGKSDK